ncbi:MAG: molecular chaperone DnaJ [Phycisphaeraceae bacterium]|nr:molecular chaperone DnaJ [Phycisphaeraceae bacterium]
MSQTKPDYYELLGVDRQSSGDQIKRAYRKAAMKYHPDRNPDDPEAEEQFKLCAEAYEVLADPDKRQRYDQFGHEGLRGSGVHDFEGMKVTDIFSMFEDLFGEQFGSIFGGRGGRGRGGVQRGYDLETHLEIELEDVLTETTHTVEFTRQDLCETCGGSGAKPGSTPVACVQCGGSGQEAFRQGFFQMSRTCRGCGGSGQVITDRCKACDGSGREPTQRKLEIKIPPGVHDGVAVRVAGEGEPGSGNGPRGDLHAVVHVKPHKLFERHGNDLILRMPVSFTQAALGAKLKVPTLEGQADLRLHAGTQHGETLTLAGKGLPPLRGGRRGDIIVQVLVEIPKKLSEKQEQLLREFAETEDHDVMPTSRGFWDKLKGYLGGD